MDYVKRTEDNHTAKLEELSGILEEWLKALTINVRTVVKETGGNVVIMIQKNSGDNVEMNQSVSLRGSDISKLKDNAKLVSLGERVIESEVPVNISVDEAEEIVTIQQLGTLLQAKSLVASCNVKGHKKALINSVKNFSVGAKKEFVVFISAVTQKPGNNEQSLEYMAAKELIKKLQKNNIKYFWWEDAAKLELGNGKTIGNEWYISTKISMGLAFSSVFVGLAFDSAKKTSDGKYELVKLKEEENGAISNLKYEADTFISLMGGANNGAEIKNTQYAKRFTRGIVKGADFNSRVPQKRYFMLFTYGEPDDYGKYYVKGNEKLKYFDNIDDDAQNRLIKITPDEKKAERIAETVYNKISELIKNDSDLRRLCAPRSIAEEFFKPYFVDAAKKDVRGRIDMAEDADIIPSDYYFAYAVVDKNNKSAKKHFTFFPESYNSDGILRWRIKAVIKDWNYSKIDEKDFEKKYPLSKFKEAVLCLGKGEGRKSRIVYYDDESKTVDSFGQTGTLTVWDESKKEGVNEIYGTIDMREPRDGGTDGIKSETFYYSVIFAPKKIVHYSVDDCGDGNVKFRINGKIEDIKDVKVEVVNSGNDNMACFGAVNASGQYSVGSLINEPFEKLHKYCLRPVDDYARYYIFLNDSYIQNTKEQKPVNDENSKKCPCCGRFLTSDAAKIKEAEKDNFCIHVAAGDDGKGIYLCQHNFVHQYWNKNGEKGNFNIISDIGAEGIVLDDRKKLVLPEEIKRNKVAVISMAGVSQSGKSTFISSLFRTGSEIPDCTQIAKKLQPYVRKTDFEGIKSAEVSADKSELNEDMLEKYYKVELYKDFVMLTTNSEKKNKVISHIPYVMHLKNIQGTSDGAYLSFFDAPGGFLYDNETMPFAEDINSTMFFRSDALILLVNATPGNGSESDDVSLKGAQAIIGKIEELAKQASKKYLENISLAVVICKFDEFAGKFDPNSYVRTLPPEAAGNKFGGSPREEYINGCSAEIESYLGSQKRYGEFMSVVSKFPNHKFFAVSSIGRRDSVNGGKEGYRTVYFTEPRNTENVLLWIMYRAGIII